MSSLAHSEGRERPLYLQAKRGIRSSFFFLQIQILRGLSPTWSESLSTTSGRRPLEKTNAMATPLRKVLENHRLTLKRVRIATTSPLTMILQKP